MGMSPVERLTTAAAGAEPDRVPVILRFKPVYFKKWYRSVGRDPGDDLESQLRAQLEFFRQWPEVVPLLPSPPNQGAVGLLAWLGRKLPSDTPPPSAHWTLDDLRRRFRSAKLPDAQADEWMPEALGQWQEYIDRLPPDARRAYGGLVWCLQVPGPLSGLGSLLSYVDTFRLLYREPRLLHDLFAYHSESVAGWVRAVEGLFVRSGLPPCQLMAYEEMLPMISPDHAEEFCAPYLKQVYDASRTPLKILHCDNRVSHMPGTVVRSGANVYFGNFSDYSELKRSFAGKVALMGNVPSLSVLTDGGPGDVRECCRWLLAQCAPGGGFILSSGGGFDPSGQTPFENITEMVRSAEAFGRYPVELAAGPVPERYRTVLSLHFRRAEVPAEPARAPELERVAAETCRGEAAEAQLAVEEALRSGHEPREILLRGLCAGVRRATALFYREEYFYPEIDRSGLAYEAGLAALGPGLPAGCFRGTVVIGTLKGSYQEAGLRLVDVMLRGAGVRVENLGLGVEPERFVQEARERGADVIAMAVYFYQHAKLAEDVTRLVREQALNIRTLAGGMGITPDRIGRLDVDAYAASGLEARDRVEALVGGD